MNKRITYLVETYNYMVANNQQKYIIKAIFVFYSFQII